MRSGGELRRFWRAPLLMAGAFVLLFWVFALGQTEHSVFGRVPILDEVYYLDRAAELAGAETPLTEPYFMSPLYPRLVAFAGAGGGVPEDRVFAGAELRGLRLLQIFCWLGTLILIRLLAARLVPADWTGRAREVALWLPVILFALYRPAAVYALAVLLETPLLFLVTFTVYLMSARRPQPAWILLLGVSLGLAGLLRGTTLLLVPVAMVFLWCGLNLRSALRLGLLATGVVVALAPAVVHNSRVVGHAVGPTLNGGVNLYIGNGPEANGFYVAAVPGDWRHDPAGREFLAQRFGLPAVSLAAADRMWSDEAWRHMRNDPGRVVGLMGRKIWLQIQGWEIDQLTPLAGWKAQVPVLRMLLAPYALLVVLGFAGLVSLKGNRMVWVVAAALVVLLVGQSLFFVVSRYRLVLVPLWSVLAGMGAVHLYQRQRAALVLALVAMILSVPWGLNNVRESWAALGQANEALRWADVGAADGSVEALQKAESLYRQSLSVAETRPASWLGLAVVLNSLQRPSEAGDVLREGVAKASPAFALQKVLLAHELEVANPEAALGLALAILREHPRDAETLHNAVVLLSRSGQPERALVQAQALRDFHPENPQGHIDVGVLLARSGRHHEAKAAFENGLRHCPDHPGLVHNLAQVGP